VSDHLLGRQHHQPVLPRCGVGDPRPGSHRGSRRRGDRLRLRRSRSTGEDP
jgi:hypothetical protein